jgi:DNA-binding response OmpR family regulator
MKKPVLLVDDPKQALRPLASALAAAGYEVRACEGLQAVDAFARATPELMFIQLSEGGGAGVTIAEQIRQRADGALVPILFVGTGQDMITSVSDALAVGGDFFFQHPIDLEKVLAKVRAYIGVSEAPSEDEVTRPNAPADDSWEDFDFDAQGAKRKWVDATVRSEAESERRLEDSPTSPAIDTEAVRKQVAKRQEDEAKRRNEELALREAQARAQKQAEALAKQHEEALVAMEHRRREEEEQTREKIEREMREKIAAELSAREAQAAAQRAEAERLKLRRVEEERAAAAKRTAEEEERKRAAEDARARAQLEVQKRAETEAQKRAEDERKRAEEERLRAQAEAQKRAEADAQKRAETEARVRVEAQKRFEQETRDRIEAEARKQIETIRTEMENKLRAEAQARGEEEARRRGEQEARERFEQETRERLAQEARDRLEEERKRAEEERRQVEEDARRRVEQEAQRRRDEELRHRLESEAQRKQAEEQQQRIEEEIRARIEHEYAAARGFALPQPASDPGVDGLRVQPPQLLMGQLSDRHVAGVLGGWAAEHITGKVVFTHGNQEKILALEHGQPVAFFSSDAMDRFEEFLLREHLLTRQQYQACRLRQLGGPRQTGAFIVSEGYLKPEELFDAVRRHLEENVHNLLEWEEGAWIYRPELAAAEERIVLTTNAERLIVDGVRRRYLLARMIRLLGPPSSLLVPSGVEIQPDRLGVDAKERALYKLLDGTRAIEDLVFSSGMSEERVYQLLTALESLGLVTVAVRGQEAEEGSSLASDAIDRARIKERFELAKKADYFEFLSIPAAATEFDIERALAGAKKLYATERFASHVSQELSLELKEIERVLADAEYVLRDARLRDAYVQHLGRRSA